MQPSSSLLDSHLEDLKLSPDEGNRVFFALERTDNSTEHPSQRPPSALTPPTFPTQTPLWLQSALAQQPVSNRCQAAAAEAAAAEAAAHNDPFHADWPHW